MKDYEIAINDCFVDVFGEPPKKAEIDMVYSTLPTDIFSDAEKWGWNDTVVGDKIHKILTVLKSLVDAESTSN